MGSCTCWLGWATRRSCESHSKTKLSRRKPAVDLLPKPCFA
jgi:hypothetical protein